MTSKTAFQIHKITAENATTDKLESLRAVALAVFDTPEDAGRPSQQPSNWQANIAHPHAAIFYATKSEPDGRADEPLGFFFATPRTQPEIGSEILHLWMAAILPESRGHGLFPLMMARLKAHARECGYEQMTVCTYPHRFKTMYRILCANGWELVAWIEEKVLMRTDL